MILCVKFLVFKIFINLVFKLIVSQRNHKLRFQLNRNLLPVCIMLRSSTTRCIGIAMISISTAKIAASSHKLPDLHCWQYTCYTRFYYVSMKVACSNTDWRCLKRENRFQVLTDNCNCSKPMSIHV